MRLLLGGQAFAVDAGIEVLGKPPGWARGRQRECEAAHEAARREALAELGR
jgi:hypothetical protein